VRRSLPALRRILPPDGQHAHVVGTDAERIAPDERGRQLAFPVLTFCETASYVSPRRHGWRAPCCDPGIVIVMPEMQCEAVLIAQAAISGLGLAGAEEALSGQWKWRACLAICVVPLAKSAERMITSRG
jgi:hypothetical protein